MALESVRHLGPLPAPVPPLLCLLPSPNPEVLQLQRAKEGIACGLLPSLPANREILKKADAEGDQGRKEESFPPGKAPGLQAGQGR